MSVSSKIYDCLIAIGVPLDAVEAIDFNAVPEKALRGVVAIVAAGEDLSKVGLTMLASAARENPEKALREVIEAIDTGIRHGLIRPEAMFQLVFAIATGTALATPDHDQKTPEDFHRLCLHVAEQASEHYEELRAAASDIRAAEGIRADLQAIEANPDLLDGLLP